jgi:hypothetical protein
LSSFSISRAFAVPPHFFDPSLLLLLLLFCNSFDVCEPYHGFVGFLHYLILIGVFLYFITSSDSGSFVDDLISANGHANPPPIQKVYWCWTEGLTAIALIKAGGADSISALKSVSIVSGLPYTFAICFMCTSIYRCVKVEAGELDIVNAAAWTTDVFDITCLFDGETYLNKMARLKSLILGAAMPFVGLNTTLMELYGKRVYALVGSVFLSALWYTWFVLIFTGYVGNAASGQTAFEYFQWLNVANLGWVIYVAYAIMVACVRTEVRVKKNIYGSTLEDFCTTLCLPNVVISQLAYETGRSVSLDGKGIPI